MSERDELAALRRMAELEMRAIKSSEASRQVTAARIEADPISRGARAFPTKGGGFLPGIGSAIKKYGMGALQIAAPSIVSNILAPEFAQERGTIERDVAADLEGMEAERRRLNQPLERTAGGRLGQFAGDVAMVAPTAIIPGANTVAGSALIGGGIGALQPTLGDESRLFNTALGAGVAGGVSGGLKGIAMLRAAREAKGLTEAGKNALRDQTIREGFDAGYVVPPSAVHKGGTFLGNRMEGIAGKAALNQESSIRNQQITNQLARKAASLADDAPITPGNLKQARTQLAAPYREVGTLSPRAQIAFEQSQQARFDANDYYRAYAIKPDPNTRKSAEALLARVATYEKLINKEAVRVGRADLLPALKAARVALAKNFDVERALNVATGDVDASIIGRMVDKAPGKYTGELATIGKFQQAFPAFTREASKVQAPGVSKLEAAGGALLGLGGAAATGSPAGLLAGALPFLSSPTRSLALSQIMQNVPRYGPGATLRLADLAARNQGVQRALPPLVAAGIVPQVSQ